MAACLSCALHPLYKRLQIHMPGWKGALCYVVLLFLMIFLPVAVLVLLVAPQATAGYHMLQRLRESNFQMPPAWLEIWGNLKGKFSAIPGFETTLNDFTKNFDAMMGKTISAALSGGVGLVGSTFSAFWLTFLFLTLSVLCTIHASRLYSLAAVLTRLPLPILDRFLLAIRGALRGVLLGVVLVALAQGVLCGLGFAAAGIKQPAFWGMLATLTAPIPLVGTALVWLPLCVMLWFTGSSLAAVGLVIWGVLVVAGVDNLLRPLFLKQGINAPITVLVLAILCGLASFGPVGLIAGPVLVAFAIQAIEEADNLRVARRMG